MGIEEIGGFFSVLENKGVHYHKNTLKLNTARNAFEYILRAKKYKKVYLPYYICNVMLEPIKKLGLDYKFYEIDEKFEMKSLEMKIEEDAVIVYVNYFGLKNNYIGRKLLNFKNIIIDSTQAFYSKPISNLDTIYSCRKFFPVLDGSYLYTDQLLDKEFERNFVYDRVEFLFKKYELDSNSAYDLYLRNEDVLCNQDIKKMSKISENILCGIDYEKIKIQRERNFIYLHNIFSKINELTLDLNDLSGPMIYPLLISKDIKRKLISKKIYLATYWPEVLKMIEGPCLEERLVKYLLPLPIDHRYDIKHLEYLVKVINEVMKEVNFE